jgi:hypothetical protein
MISLFYYLFAFTCQLIPIPFIQQNWFKFAKFLKTLLTHLQSRKYYTALCNSLNLLNSRREALSLSHSLNSVSSFGLITLIFYNRSMRSNAMKFMRRQRIILCGSWVTSLQEGHLSTRSQDLKEIKNKFPGNVCVTERKSGSNLPISR